VRRSYALRAAMRLKATMEAMKPTRLKNYESGLSKCVGLVQPCESTLALPQLYGTTRIFVVDSVTTVNSMHRRNHTMTVSGGIKWEGSPWRKGERWPLGRL
jgi:hypothetical protein